MQWPELLEPIYQERKFLLCPSAKKAPFTGIVGGRSNAWLHESASDANDFYIGSYGFNYWEPSRDMGGWQIPNAPKPARTPLFFDCAQPYVTPFPTDQPPEYDWPHPIPPTSTSEMHYCCINRHSQATVNCLFLDFSARKVGLKELWKLRWNSEWDESGLVIPVWPKWMMPLRGY